MRRRYVYVNGALTEVAREYAAPEPVAGYYIMGDIKPYRSMIDGREITSRSGHREHLRDHGCVEVGNDSSVLQPKYNGQTPPPGLKEKLIRATDEHWHKLKRR